MGKGLGFRDVTCALERPKTYENTLQNPRSRNLEELARIEIYKKKFDVLLEMEKCEERAPGTATGFY